MGYLRELSRVREYLIGVGIAGMVVSGAAFTSLSGGAPASSPAPESAGGYLIESAFASIQPAAGEYRAPAGSQMSGLRLASLPTQVTVVTESAGNERQTAAAIPATDRASFDERFFSIYGDRFASFDERFAGRDRAPASRSVWRHEWLTSAKRRLETLDDPEPVRLASLSPATDAPAVTETKTPPRVSPEQSLVRLPPSKPMRLAYAPSNLPLTDEGNRNARTAIYDISARAVYMPNGERLEAHSGLGEHMDDLRTFRIKNKGVTPPNVYKLTLRKRLFHGVRAVRMTPVDPSKMYGRDGFLVHSYLLGPKGESNGCVSVENYDKFLKAFDDGKVDRLVVVERLENPPSSPTEPGGNNWLAERIKALFESS